MNVWGAPLSWVPLEFLHTQAFSNSSITDQTSLPHHWFSSQCVSSLWVSGLAGMTPGICLSLQSWGSPFPCVPYLSYRCKKNCWFFTLFSFLLVKTEGWHPSSPHREPERGSSVEFFLHDWSPSLPLLSLSITILCRKPMWVDGGCLQTRKVLELENKPHWTLILKF